MNKLLFSAVLALVSGAAMRESASAQSANYFRRAQQARDLSLNGYHRNAFTGFGEAGVYGYVQPQNPKVKKGDTRFTPDGCMQAYRGKGEWYTVHCPATQPRGVTTENGVGYNGYSSR